jgi:hypothetical protein
MKFLKCVLVLFYILIASGCAVSKNNSIKEKTDFALFDNDNLISVNTNFNENNITKVVK